VEAATMGAENQSLQMVLGQFPAEKGSLIPILQKVQACAGYISSQAAWEISQALRLTESQVYGVASFYSQFRFTPPGRHRFHVCLGTACHVRGGQALLDTLELRLGIREGETTPDRKFEINRVACLGCCALAPVVKVGDRIHAQVSVLKLRELVEEHDKA
jgi:NADH-quinone oxidoreductase subunit E